MYTVPLVEGHTLFYLFALVTTVNLQTQFSLDCSSCKMARFIVIAILFIVTGVHGIRSTWLCRHQLPGPISTLPPPTTPPSASSTIHSVEVSAIVGSPEKLPTPQPQLEHPNSVYWSDEDSGVLPPKPFPVSVAPFLVPSLQLKGR